MQAIQTDKLTKYYGKARGIDKLDLSVEQGEFFGFIGPNGAGKSTTIRTLLGLIFPTAGSALVLGNDIRKDRQKILENTGYLPSEVSFYPGMRVRDALRLSADLRRKDCEKEAASLCERLRLDPTRCVSDLSFGNRKKVGIVCALQHRPKLLILDEPTGGLDPLIQKAFFDILSERHAAGDTVFISSHVLSEIRRHCGRAAIIKDGRVIACDRVEALARSNVKRVSVRGRLSLAGVPGVKDAQQTGGGMSFLYSGDSRTLLSLLSSAEIEDFSVTDPDLEEIVLHFYEQEGEPA